LKIDLKIINYVNKYKMSVTGLTITRNFISKEYEKELIQKLTNEEWNLALKRRT
jgi:hypothetical protein